jgi:hypothetical protein
MPIPSDEDTYPKLYEATVASGWRPRRPRPRTAPCPHLLPRADALVTRAVRPLGPTSLPSTLSSLAAPSGVSRSWRVSLLWLLCPQVKAGSIFDNILVCDDPDFAKAEAEKNIVPLQEKEKEMKKKVDDEEAETRRKEEVCVPWLPRR